MADYSRISITIDNDLLARLDDFIRRSGHGNRSEVIRDLVRARLVDERGPDDTVVGSLTTVYDHHQRELAERLTEAAHGHHALVLATLHVHLDHDRCLELSALRGQRRALRHYADHVLGMKGVMHGDLTITAEEPEAS